MAQAVAQLRAAAPGAVQRHFHHPHVSDDGGSRVQRRQARGHKRRVKPHTPRQGGIARSIDDAVEDGPLRHAARDGRYRRGDPLQAQGLDLGWR